MQFDIVFSLSNKEKFFLEIFIFGTALKSGLVETIPTGPVATALLRGAEYHRCGHEIGEPNIA